MSDTKISRGQRTEIKKGEILFQREDTVEKIYLLVSGQVTAKNEYLQMNLESGAIIGILDIQNDVYLFDYIAESDLILLGFEISQTKDVRNIFSMGKNYQELAMLSACAQFRTLYQLYEEKFAIYGSELKEFSKISDSAPTKEVDIDRCNYLKEIAALNRNVFHELFSGNDVIAYLHLELVASLAKDINGVAELLIDILHDPALLLEEESSLKESRFGEDFSEDSALVQQELNESDDNEQRDETMVLEELSGATRKILTYAQLEPQRIAEFMLLLEQYRKYQERNARTMDPNMISIRRKIADYFYEVYEIIFLKTRKEKKVDRLIEMFLTLGFMDEQGFGQKVLMDLYYLKSSYETSKYKVHTIYDWLCAIYQGDREPSKNEYDMDYKGYLRELKRSKAFTPQEEKAFLEDQENKIHYEITNFVRIASRLTSGEPSSFCPILSQANFLRNVNGMLVTAKKVEQALDQILDVDYSLFYREQMYYDKESRIDNILIMQEVLPDIILLPDVGSRCMMWQEISEKKRNTPARFILPEFTTEDLTKMMIYMAGTFRWEMCRVIQGNYWNDIREHSLTSDYCDYIQFYRKNRELSEDAKNKVKNQLKSCRNHYREMFAKDYDAWIRFESNGMMHLNKVTRKIMYQYCPFSLEYRDKLKAQPAYTELAMRFSNNQEKKVKEIRSFLTGVRNKNGKITKELEDHLKFYEEL